ncbi:MAG: alanyl-tRNA editing protein [Thermotogota bacterium]|nr:alanyl-tRNA editing protein [Thermotogota bacterium]
MIIKIANVLKGKRFTKVCFDSNNLFPDGEGGQLGDRGIINGERFVFVERRNKQICVSVDTEKNFEIGKTVELEVNESRRYDIAQQHTAQHLLSAIISKEFSAETKGFQIREEYSTIVIDLPQFEVSHEKIVEKYFFDEVKQCRDVYEEQYPIEKINSLDLRKPVDSDLIEKGEKIRIVNIKGIDRIACSGLHVDNTGELGFLKILKTEKKKSKLTRLYFVAGLRALKYYQKIHHLTKWINNELTCGLNEIPDKLKKMEEEIKELKRNENELHDRLAKFYAKKVNEEKGLCRFLDAEKSIIEKIPNYINSKRYVFIGRIEENKFMIFSKEIDLKTIFSHIKKELSVNGGCGKTKGQIVTNIPAEKLVDNIEKFLREE